MRHRNCICTHCPNYIHLTPPSPPRSYLTALATSKMQVERSGILHTLVTGEFFLKPAQARLILSQVTQCAAWTPIDLTLLQCLGSTERIAFVAAAIYRIHSTNPPHQEIERLKSLLSPVERR